MNGIEITAIGNMTKDADLKFSSQGRAWATFSVAVNEISTVNGEKRENVTYLDCKVFGDQAEYLVESAGKGTRVFVTGKLRDEKWKDQSGNDRRTKTLIVDEVGVSVRWATANVTRKSPSNSSSQGQVVSTNGESINDSSDDENPFI